MKHRFTTDLTTRTNKPQAKEIGLINNQLKVVVEATISEYSDMMSKGFTFTPAVFKDNQRSNANWLGQSIFAFDFDNGVSPETIIARLAEYQITPNVIYTSFSDTPELRKFRVVLFVDTVVVDEDIRNTIQRGMMDLLQDVDKACKDAARLYFGGRKSEVLNETPIHLDKLLILAETSMIASDSGKIRNLSKNPTSYKSIIEDVVFGQNEQIKNFDFKKLEEEVELFKSFIGGDWLAHTELFGLATSLLHIEGGAKLMKDTMVKYNKLGTTKYTENNFAIMKYVSFRGYQPQRLESYSPFESDREHLNLITAVRDIRGFVEKVKDIPMITLKQAERVMKDTFKEVVDAKDNNIYIIKLPTGIGKTKMLEVVPFTIALPTNDLKDEVYGRVVVKKSKTPTFPEMTDREINDKVNNLYRIGLDKVAIKMILKLSKQNTIDGEKCKKYLEELRKAYVSDDCVVTTHSRAIYSEFKSDTIVFDEDPLQMLLQVKSFDIADLLKIEASIEGNEISNLIDVLRKATAGVLMETPMVTFDIASLVEQATDAKITSNLIAIASSDYIIREPRKAGSKVDSNIFHYISRKDLPTNKKVIILSATIPTDIYTALYGDRVKIVDITNVEQVGQVIQITKRSCSRTSMRNATNTIVDMIDTTLPTITFKEFINEIPNAVKDMYFGNVAGYDELKGQDINIVGTPHLNNILYLLMGKAIGLKLKPADLEMSYRKIQYGNHKFKFNCYDNEDLMKIQLSLIEAELIQAVGRNRTLREDCTAYVYSNLPLSVATEIKTTHKK